MANWWKRYFVVTALGALVGAVGVGSVGAAQPAKKPPANSSDKVQLVSWAKSKVKFRGGDTMPMGAIPSRPSLFKKTPGLKFRDVNRDRPSKLLLLDYLPPVQFQGKQQSCVAWSSGYYTYTYAVAKALQLNPEQRDALSRKFSPAFIYHLGNGGEDQGMEPAQGFEILKENGCATLAEMPYDPNDYTSKPTEDALKRAERYKAMKIAHLFEGLPRSGSGPNIEGLKTYLYETQNPFVMAISVFRDFPMKSVSPDYVYDRTTPPATGDFIGFHALTVIGYDDDKHAFRIINSWGPKWGDKGYLWLSEHFVHDYCVEGWALVAGGPTLRDKDSVKNAWTKGNLELVPPQQP